MIRLSNISVNFDDESSLKDVAANVLGISNSEIKSTTIVKKAVDARRYKGQPVLFVYTLDVETYTNEKNLLKKFEHDKSVSKTPIKSSKDTLSSVLQEYANKSVKSEFAPVVVGFGPAGMFAALTLARAGYCPVVFERGADVYSREKAVNRFWTAGKLDENTNVQFGEGGAGTFSDGKLTARNLSFATESIIEDFIKFGAPEEIRYLKKPHIGTDNLKNVVKNLRQEIIRLGGKVKFFSKVTDIEVKDNAIRAVIVNGEERIGTNAVFLGLGHSARDTYKMLFEKGVKMESKPFAVGVRIEHPQEFINAAQYGVDAGNPKLSAASYAVTYADKETGRGVYSFCMCPGGFVVAAASGKNQAVTNGMSNFNRDSGIANSALLANVTPADFSMYGKTPLNGMFFQADIEERAFRTAGGDYFAPIVTVGDFLDGKCESKMFLTVPTYRPGVRVCDFRNILPNFVTEPLKRALLHFNAKIKRFSERDVVMTGVESRSSAPVRIIRDKENMCSKNCEGLYPIGEGAGYAGGIMSAAADGIKSVLAFLRKNDVE